MYRRESGFGFFDEGEEQPEVEDHLLEDVLFSELQQGVPPDEVQSVLKEIQNMVEEELEPEDPDNDKLPPVVDPDLSLPDGAKLVDLTKDSPSETEQLDAASFPFTLSAALSGDRRFWAGLWQLTVALRCGRDGVDSKFLRKAEVVRKRSRKLNWHQLLGHKLIC